MLRTFGPKGRGHTSRCGPLLLPTPLTVARTLRFGILFLGEGALTIFTDRLGDLGDRGELIPFIETPSLDTCGDGKLDG